MTSIPPVEAGGLARVAAVLLHLGDPPVFRAAFLMLWEMAFDVIERHGSYRSNFLDLHIASR
jgi:hypothetical protein